MGDVVRRSTIYEQQKSNVNVLLIIHEQVDEPLCDLCYDLSEKTNSPLVTDKIIYNQNTTDELLWSGNDSEIEHSLDS